MAIFHCHISNVSRANGSVAVATASYITGQRLRCERNGDLYDYGRKQRVVDVATYLPAHAPSEWKDPSQLFNAIENFDNRKNFRVAKKIEVALPREFDLNLQKKVTAEYCKQLTKRGYACTCALHTDADNNNPHAHILVANRKINNKGQFVKKTTKTVAKLDEHGNRIPLIDPETGEQKLDSRNRKQWKRQTIQYNWLDEREAVQELRAYWSNECNKYLMQENQISEKKLKEQDLPYSRPTIHEGYKARAMERKGEVSDVCEYNREVQTHRAWILKLMSLLAREIKREEKQQERRQQVEQIVNPVKEVISDSVEKASSVAKDTGNKVMTWWKNVAQPALADAITPTEIDHAHSEEWDNFQEIRHIEKQREELSKLEKKEQEIINGHYGIDDLRWFWHQNSEKMYALREEIEEYDNKHPRKALRHTQTPSIGSYSQTTPTISRKQNIKPKQHKTQPSPYDEKKRPLSPLELQQMAQAKRASQKTKPSRVKDDEEYSLDSIGQECKEWSEDLATARNSRSRSQYRHHSHSR